MASDPSRWSRPAAAKPSLSPATRAKTPSTAGSNSRSPASDPPPDVPPPSNLPPRSLLRGVFLSAHCRSGAGAVRFALNRGEGTMSLSAAELVKLVRPGSWLAEVPAACLEKLAPLGQVRTFAKGKTVFQKGDEGDFMGVVL